MFFCSFTNLKLQKCVVLLLTWLFGGITGSNVSKLLTNDKIPNVTSYKTKEVSTLLQCQHVCFREKTSCKSFNVIPLRNMKFDCQIIQSKIDTNVEFQESPGASHYQVTNIGKDNGKSPDNGLPCAKNLGGIKSSCSKWKEAGYTENGVYKFKVQDSIAEVYCDMETDGGGWIVFQQRLDGSVDFYRNWTDYKKGFGTMCSTFWLGNELLHKITSSSPTGTELWVEGTKFDGTIIHAKFASFSVGSEAEQYKMSNSLTYIAGISQAAANDVLYAAGSRFSTFDSDGDMSASSCALTWKSGWWFNNCFYINLNGIYSTTVTPKVGSQAIVWRNSPSGDSALKKSRMMLRLP